MTEIRRNVEIKPPEVFKAKLRVKGKKGGEMIISLRRKRLCPGNTVSPLLIDCYRTRRIHSFDVSNYNGNKGEIIKVRINGDNQDLIKSIICYIAAPDERLIEYGELKRNNRHSSDRPLFEYKTKISHGFREIKVICCENLSYNVKPFKI